MITFYTSIFRCQQALDPKGLNILDIITSTDPTTFDNILHSFVGIAAVQIGLTNVLQKLGLVPDKIIGNERKKIPELTTEFIVSNRNLKYATYHIF